MNEGISSLHRKYNIDIFVNKQLVPFRIDTGADLYVIKKKTAMLIKGNKIHKYNRGLLDVGGRPLHHQGIIMASIEKWRRGGEARWCVFPDAPITYWVCLR